MASATESPSRAGSGESLRADAQAWVPAPRASQRESPVKPIRTSGRQRGDVLATLDDIPFTPSQGVCTPSPTNMAAMWVPHPFFQQQQQAWTTMAAFAGSPSSGGSDSSMLHASQPGSPSGAMYGSNPAVMWGGFAAHMPYSPTALQIAAASGALGSDPSTPVRGRPGSAGAAAAAAMAAGGPFMMPGSPVVFSPGQMMFAQYFGTDAGARQQGSHSPPEDSGSGDEGEGSDGGMSSAGSGSLEVSDAARQIASAMCAAQQLPGEPPQQLLELASLLHAYGLVSAVPAYGPPPPTGGPSSAPLSPDSKRQAARQRQKNAPKLNGDGSVRLNARQRRTLRRAQERAMKALLEAQTSAHGISSEQAASNLASMGVTSMLLGSPPPAPAPVHFGNLASMMQHMPALPAYSMAPPPMPAMPLSPGMPGLHNGPPMYHAHDLAVMANAMMQQHAAAAAALSAGLDMTSGFGVSSFNGDLPMSMPMPMMQQHSTPPQRHAGNRASPAGFGGPRSSPGGTPGYRGTPGSGRMSRFAPPDAVAAY